MTLRKFLSLEPRTGLRKLWQILRAAEASLRLQGIRQGSGPEDALKSYPEPDWNLLEVIDIRIAFPDFPEKEALAKFLDLARDEGGNREQRIRALNQASYTISSFIGIEAADWDLFPPLQSRGNSMAASSEDDPRGHRDTRYAANERIVYLDALRSPFNVGSIFRTADAFGFSRIVLSPDCPRPDHPRAARASMNATAYLDWEISDLENFLANRREESGGTAGLPVFALELGGKDIRDFEFPRFGLAILGSEELGVDPRLLDIAEKSLGRVSISQLGFKASLNVGVAFGILAHSWSRARVS